MELIHKGNGGKKGNKGNKVKGGNKGSWQDIWPEPVGSKDNVAQEEQENEQKQESAAEAGAGAAAAKAKALFQPIKGRGEQEHLQQAL
jgi:hypothetical protein